MSGLFANEKNLHANSLSFAATSRLWLCRCKLLFRALFIYLNIQDMNGLMPFNRQIVPLVDTKRRECVSGAVVAEGHGLGMCGLFCLLFIYSPYLARLLSKTRS